MKSKVIKGRSAPLALFRRDGSARTAGAITKARGGYAIADTSTTAKKGDIYRPETATTSVMVGKEYVVIDASTNSFTIASKDLPTAGDTFYILGKTTQRVGSDGAISATIAGGATEAKQDTMITSLQLLDNAVSGNEFQVDVVTSALPSGAATAAHQVTQNTLQTSMESALADINLIVGTPGGALVAKAAQVAGSDGTNARFLKTDASGELQVDILSSALPSGASTSALQSTIDASINTLLKPADTLTAVTTVTTVGAVTAITNALPAGTNNIGDVDILSIAAGDNNIGNVDVVTLPALPAGTNNIGDVDVLTLPAIPAGTNMIGYQTPAAASGNTNAMSSYSSTAYENAEVVKGSAGRLYQLTGYNSKTSAQFIQIHNTTTVVADTAVPIFVFSVPAQSNFSIDFFPLGRYFSTGIMVCNSTTGPTKTIGAADCWFNVEYL